jgi:hypothetical protein
MPWHGLARRFPALGYRDFRLLLADRLLAPGAFAFSLVGVSFAVLDATGSTADLSYVLAAQIFPSLVFALVGGVFADRFAPQKVIVAINPITAVGEGGFGLLVLLGNPAAAANDRAGDDDRRGHGRVLPRLTGAPAPAGAGPPAREASAMSRLAMNGAQMAGAAIMGVFVAHRAGLGASRAGSACSARCRLLQHQAPGARGRRRMLA